MVIILNYWSMVWIGKEHNYQVGVVNSLKGCIMVSIQDHQRMNDYVMGYNPNDIMSSHLVSAHKEILMGA